MTKPNASKKVKSNYKQESLLRHVKKNWKIYSFLILPILYYVIFKYVPMAGNIIAFRRYKGGPNIFGDDGSASVTLNSS